MDSGRQRIELLNDVLVRLTNDHASVVAALRLGKPYVRA